MRESVKGFNALRPRTLPQEVGDVLREAILSAKLEPGQRLIIDNLVQEFRISRIPIREALGQLAQQGLVTIVPHQGARVVRPTHTESFEALAVRVHLELLAARLAAVRLDTQSLEAMADIVRRMEMLAANGELDAEQMSADFAVLDWQFHRHLMAASGSVVLQWIWSVIGPYLWVTHRFGRILRRREQPIAESPEVPVNERVELHRSYLEAVRSGDVNRAERAVQHHYARAMAQAAHSVPSALVALPWLGEVSDPARAGVSVREPEPDQRSG